MKWNSTTRDSQQRPLSFLRRRMKIHSHGIEYNCSARCAALDPQLIRCFAILSVITSRRSEIVGLAADKVVNFRLSYPPCQHEKSRRDELLIDALSSSIHVTANGIKRRRGAIDAGDQRDPPCLSALENRRESFLWKLSLCSGLLPADASLSRAASHCQG